MSGLALAVAVALAFDLTNGFHDSANSVAALVATRAARPAAAILLVSVFYMLGPFLAGTAVADTVGGLVTLDGTTAITSVGAALTGALAWNLLTWWRGLPSSSSHALVGGLVGAAMVEAGGGAVHWGGVEGLRPAGVLGVLAALAVSPLLGFGAGLLGARAARRATRRASVAMRRSVLRAEWFTASALAFSNGANDAQKTMGVITLLLVADGRLDTFSVPVWVKLAAAITLTFGTSLGGWRIVRTVGGGIYRLRPLDGLVSQSGSAAVVLTSAAIGAPVSTTHVVASSVVGVGAGQRWRHVRWAVVREMGLGWLVTLPASAALGAAAVPVWRWLV
ncbi:MAG: inorganic phosphate transporter [Acidimicrobiia bacterium]|nr:inorganic phosphate transporter [Acidimicrobiia bacterium]